MYLFNYLYTSRKRFFLRSQNLGFCRLLPSLLPDTARSCLPGWDQLSQCSCLERSVSSLSSEYFPAFCSTNTEGQVRILFHRLRPGGRGKKPLLHRGTTLRLHILRKAGEADAIRGECPLFRSAYFISWGPKWEVMKSSSLQAFKLAEDFFRWVKERGRSNVTGQYNVGKSADKRL